MIANTIAAVKQSNWAPESGMVGSLGSHLQHLGVVVQLHGVGMVAIMVRLITSHTFATHECTSALQWYHMVPTVVDVRVVRHQFPITERLCLPVKYVHMSR